jgi:hypothetical protein
MDATSLQHVTLGCAFPAHILRSPRTAQAIELASSGGWLAHRNGNQHIVHPITPHKPDRSRSGIPRARQTGFYFAFTGELLAMSRLR